MNDGSRLDGHGDGDGDGLTDPSWLLAKVRVTIRNQIKLHVLRFPNNKSKGAPLFECMHQQDLTYNLKVNASIHHSCWRSHVRPSWTKGSLAA